jgi:hypothetical protein
VDSVEELPDKYLRVVSTKQRFNQAGKFESSMRLRALVRPDIASKICPRSFSTESVVSGPQIVAKILREMLSIMLETITP